jgi:phosphoketolase
MPGMSPQFGDEMHDLTCSTSALSAIDHHRIEQLCRRYAQAEPEFAAWAAGYGVIAHAPLTQLRVRAMLNELVATGALPDAKTGYQRLTAADRIASAGMWLVAHMTYARRVRLDGEPLQAQDFKPQPEGHTGGALNMVPAYAGYLAMNALDGVTRAWMMGQGHCVAAIDALNVIVDNMSPAHAARYGVDEARLTRMVGDFYSYEITPEGRPASPLGSHVNAHTAGGTQEGGYLGFAELHYVHAPLPGERLVAFVSDGAFEEQRGGDWAPRWWRPDDSGLVAPIMVLNGRRIEQRSQIEQQGGEDWLYRHLRLNGFEPIGLDGRDPASIAWGIHVIESRLQACTEAAAEHPEGDFRIPLRYGVAETIKGFGFPGAGTNAAHNLPLVGNPHRDAEAREQFNAGCTPLYVPTADLLAAVATLNTHGPHGRPRERDHALATRHVASPVLPEPAWLATGTVSSPMVALDGHFVRLVDANPLLRPRVGNPDELRSNKLDATLDRLKHRVHVPEAGVAESRTGGVITALNEEAVVCAALANKGGLNLVVTYEAFAPKMLGALRQEIIFTRHLAEAGRAPGWLGVPVVLTSHTWENAKNEQSHQDPTLAEAWLGEMADVARVCFPADANSAMASLSRSYQGLGTITTLVVPKREVPNRLTPAQARLLVDEGLVWLHGDPDGAVVLLAATGAYQLGEVLRADARLRAAGILAGVVYIGEPGRLRSGRDDREAAYVLSDAELLRHFPTHTPRVFVTHTRPEPYLGALRRIDTGPATTRALGFINRGGTLDVPGLLFANRCTWAHTIAAALAVLGRPPEAVLTMDERMALAGQGDPGVITRAP